MHPTDIGGDLFDHLQFDLNGGQRKREKTKYAKTIEKYEMMSPYSILWDASLWIDILGKD